MKIVFAIIASLFLLCGCDNPNKKLLIGKWQADKILEENKPLEVDFSSINFNFTEAGMYNYQSTLDYREAGSYYLQSNLLYTLDTLNEASMEKAVKITKLTQDSLFLKMNEDGKERIMRLFRVK